MMTTEIQPVYAGGAAVVRGRPQLDIGLHARLRRGSCVERRDGLRRRLAGNSACRARLLCHTNTDDCRSARADQQRHRRETRARNLTRNYIKYARNICRAWLIYALRKINLQIRRMWLLRPLSRKKIRPSRLGCPFAHLWRPGPFFSLHT